MLVRSRTLNIRDEMMKSQTYRNSGLKSATMSRENDIQQLTAKQ